MKKFQWQIILGLSLAAISADLPALIASACLNAFLYALHSCQALVSSSSRQPKIGEEPYEKV